MHEGNLFSHEYSAKDVWRAFELGLEIGELLSKFSGKRENTEPPEDARDIHAGDDVHRAMFSEIEANMAQIGAVVPGVATRKTRAEMEQRIGRVIGGVDDHNKLTSVDITCWDFSGLMGTTMVEYWVSSR